MELPFGTSNSSAKNPKNPESPIQKNLCISMFIAVLFTIGKIWKQLKHPLVDEWIKHCGTFIQWNTSPQ